MNVENPLVNCCLYYHVKDSGDYIELYANFDKEDVFEFYDRYPNVNKILLNPSYNNEELFIGFGINEIEENPFDYIELDMNKVLNIDQKNITPQLRLSCNVNELNNLDYFLKTVALFEEKKNYILYNNYLSKLIEHISNSIFEIERIFEQQHQIEFQDEVVESYYFLKNKRVFLSMLRECLETTKYSEINEIKSIESDEENEILNHSDTENKKLDL